MNKRVGKPVWIVVALVIVAVAAAAPLISPAVTLYEVSTDTFLQPGPLHLLGTDHLGRDVLSRTVWGLRNSLAAAAVSTAIGLSLALALGLASGFMGGVVDWVLMRGVDVMLAFPGLLLALTVVAILESGLWQAALAVGIALAPVYGRLVRAAVLSVRSEPFVEAARTFGGGPIWIAIHHVLPNIAADLAAFVSLIYSWSLLNLAALDFLGVSGSPSVPTLGRLLGEGRTYLRSTAWMAVAPGLLLTLSVLAVIGLSGVWRAWRPSVGEQQG